MRILILAAMVRGVQPCHSSLGAATRAHAVGAGGRLTGYGNPAALWPAFDSSTDQAPGSGAPLTAAAGTSASRDCAEIHWRSIDSAA